MPDLSLTPHNAELFRHVQRRIRLRWQWEDVADELGCTAKEIVAWVNDYKRPAQVPTVSAPRKAMLLLPSRDRSPKKMTAQFIAWRRARDGARATREAQRNA